MKKNPVCIGLAVVLIAAAIIVVYYLKDVCYPLDKEGMISTMEKSYPDKVKISSVVVSVGGGYGTIAGTQTIELAFENHEAYLKTHFNEYDGKEEKDLARSVEVDSEKIEELYQLVQDNLWELQNNLEEGKGILDAGFSYVIVNGESYGGYAIRNRKFRDIEDKAFELMGESNIESFREEIREWFGEEE